MLPVKRRPRSFISAQEGQQGHDAEAQQEEEHLEQLLSGGVEFVREDFQKGDINEGASSQTLQDGLDERPRGQLSLHHADADGDADRRHEGKHAHVGGHPQRRNGALHQLHGQAEHDDALVDKNSDADLNHLEEKDEIQQRRFIDLN